jgi:aspartyl-tRNA(Asn)/glutamyl-tRNA(Gln) amidotransferase subunit A
VDLLAMPTIPTWLPTRAATDVDAFAAGETGPEVVAAFNAVSVNCRPFNYLGLPAISIPCGFDPHGLPIGLQLAARPFAEALLLRTADAYQRDTDWHRRRPLV